jgi:restriction endonuclease S subunit
VAGKARCFAIRRGEITRRSDVVFHQPWVRSRLALLETAKFPVRSLGSLIHEIRYGTGTPPPYLERGPDTVPFVRATDIKDGEVVRETLLYISNDQPKVMEKCRLAGGELIIVRSGVNTGDCAVIPSALAGAYAAYDLIVTFRPDTSAHFISMFLDTEIGRLQLNLVRGRAAQPHINAEEVCALRIPLPEPTQQNELLTAMNAARVERSTKLREADALLAGLDNFLLSTLGLTLPSHNQKSSYALRMRDIGRRMDAYSNQARFRKLFEYIRNSTHTAVPFSRLASRIFSGVTPLAKGNAYVTPPDGVRFIRSGEITADGEVTQKSDVHVNWSIHNGMMKRSQLEQGDLLIAIVGATIGAAGVFNRNEPANINQAIAAVRLRDECISPEFGCLYLRSSLGQALLDYFKRPVARANINLEEIGEIPVLVPSKELQSAVIMESHSRREEARRLRAAAERGWQAAKRRFEEQLLGGPLQP